MSGLKKNQIDSTILKAVTIRPKSLGGVKKWKYSFWYSHCRVMSALSKWCNFFPRRNWEHRASQTTILRICPLSHTFLRPPSPLCLQCWCPGTGIWPQNFRPCGADKQRIIWNSWLHRGGCMLVLFSEESRQIAHLLSFASGIHGSCIVSFEIAGGVLSLQKFWKRDPPSKFSGWAQKKVIGSAPI